MIYIQAIYCNKNMPYPNKIIIQGHSNSIGNKKDSIAVCSGVSILFYSLRIVLYKNNYIKLHKEYNPNIIILPKSNNKTELIQNKTSFSFFILGIKSIIKQYPDHIKYEYKYQVK